MLDNFTFLGWLLLISCFLLAHKLFSPMEQDGKFPVQSLSDELLL